MEKDEILKLAILKVQGKEIQVYSSDKISAIERKKEKYPLHQNYLWL